MNIVDAANCHTSASEVFLPISIYMGFCIIMQQNRHMHIFFCTFIDWLSAFIASPVVKNEYSICHMYSKNTSSVNFADEKEAMEYVLGFHYFLTI